LLRRVHRQQQLRLWARPSATAIQQSAPRLNELAGVVPRPGYDTPDQVMNVVREGVKTYTVCVARCRREARIIRLARMGRALPWGVPFAFTAEPFGFSND